MADACRCGCGRIVRAGGAGDTGYHSDHVNECRCGCGQRCRYAYVPGHRPEITCRRCGKVFTPGHRSENSDAMCSQCRRHVRSGGPLEKNTTLAENRRMQASSPQGRRWCGGCRRYRLLRFFGTYTESGIIKTYSRCRPCHKEQGRASMLRKKYGISAVQYAELKEFQGGRCAICQVATGAAKSLAVDHDHRCCNRPASCGDCIRGLLCSNCNNMLAFARDSAGLFQRAIDYLREPPFSRLRSRTMETR